MLRKIARAGSPELCTGEIWLGRQLILDMRTHQSTQAGIGLVPEDRRITRGLAV